MESNAHQRECELLQRWKENPSTQPNMKVESSHLKKKLHGEMWMWAPFYGPKEHICMLNLFQVVLYKVYPTCSMCFLWDQSPVVVAWVEGESRSVNLPWPFFSGLFLCCSSYQALVPVSIQTVCPGSLKASYKSNFFKFHLFFYYVPRNFYYLPRTHCLSLLICLLQNVKEIYYISSAFIQMRKN